MRDRRYISLLEQPLYQHPLTSDKSFIIRRMNTMQGQPPAMVSALSVPELHTVPPQCTELVQPQL